MSASGTQTRRLPGSNTSAKFAPLPSSTALMPGSFLPLRRAWSGRSAAALLKNVDHLAEIDHRIGDGLVLAELVIGGVQVGEIDAVKRLDVGADRLRVVERGGDQVVEIDRLDVEGLAHMGAAVAQHLHHLRPGPCAGSNCVFTACGWVMTSLSASAVAKILTRIMSMRGTTALGSRDAKPVETAIIAIRSLQKDFFAGGMEGIAKGARIGRSGDDTAMNCRRH